MVSLVACLPRMEHRECCVSEAVREGLVAQEAAAAKAAQEAGRARGLRAHSLAARLSSSALQEGAEAAAAPEAAARCGRSAGCCASTPAELVRVSSEGSWLLCFDASGMLCFDASDLGSGRGPSSKSTNGRLASTGIRQHLSCAFCDRSPCIGTCHLCERMGCRGCIEELTGECWCCLGYGSPQEWRPAGSAPAVQHCGRMERTASFLIRQAALSSAE